eukprot:8654140-Heterocapsa_arctica.AAC.1
MLAGTPSLPASDAKSHLLNHRNQVPAVYAKEAGRSTKDARGSPYPHAVRHPALMRHSSWP